MGLRICAVALLVVGQFAVCAASARAAPPANDDFDSAIAIGLVPFSTTVDTHEATEALDDPRPCGTYVFRSVWFAYTPAITGYLQVAGGTGYTDMGVFTGTRGKLTPVACDDSDGNLRFKASASTTYYFMAGGPYLTSLNFQLSMGPSGPPNDYLDGLAAMTELPYADSPDLTLATDSPTDPGCARGKSIWYSFAPGEDMRVELTWSGTLGVYAGLPTAATPSLACTGYGSTRLNLLAGNTYYISLVATGEVSFGARRVFVAPNDDFDDALSVGTLPYTTALDTVDSTTDPTDPAPHCDDPATHSVWFTFTAPRNMRVEANTFGSSYPNLISVYRGAARTYVTCDNGASIYTPGAHVVFNASAGTTYYFLVADYTYPDGGDLVFSMPLVNSLVVRPSRSGIDFGDSVKVTAHLEAFEDTANHEVSIYRTPYGGTKTLLATGSVDSSGDFALMDKPQAKTTYTAEWAGDLRYPAIKSSPSAVKVHVVATLVLKRHYAVSGGYRLYHPGTDPLFVCEVRPHHPGKKLSFVLEYKDGDWQEPIFSHAFKMGPTGIVKLVLNDPPKGVSFRARTHFAGDTDHLGDTSPWVYFRVT